jgi:fused signal recognition particle receptor
MAKLFGFLFKNKDKKENGDLSKAVEAVEKEVKELLSSSEDKKKREQQIEKLIEAISNYTPPKEKESKGFLGKLSNLKKGLSKTRKSFISKLDRIFLGKKELDEDVIEQVEELLVASDVGVKTTFELIELVEENIGRTKLDDASEVKDILKEQMLKIFKKNHSELIFNKKPFVILVVGVNGTGKTTTIGKLANKYKKMGKKVLIGAADTFRAAAIEQLEEWCKRANVDIIKQAHGADPSAVAFDAVNAAVSRGVDILLIDTAGRLHTKVNLMEELKKMVRVIKKVIPEAPHEILLVLDANTGQNAVSQAKLFKETVDVSGVVLTKLDGTAKGGIVLCVSNEFNVPVRYIGVGESVDDLKEFKPDEFVEALFS